MLAQASPDAFVFTSDPAGKRPWLPNWVTKQFIDARRRAGVGQFRLHDLRHFMATEMLNAGVPIPTVSARLAHARASTTLDVYAHAVPGGDAAAPDASGVADRSGFSNARADGVVGRRGWGPRSVSWGVAGSGGPAGKSIGPVDDRWLPSRVVMEGPSRSKECAMRSLRR